MAPRSYRWLTVILAVVGLATDQATKYGVFRWLYTDGAYHGHREVVEGWFRLTAEFDPSVPPCDCAFNSLQTWSAPVMPRVNHGALFGIGSGHKGTANQMFAAVSILAAVGIIVWVTRRATATDGWLCAALGLILGGTVGNLYDRLVFNGVRDFLHFYKIDWPVFNVADCCLVVGAGMLLVHAFLTPSQPKPEAPATEQPAPAGP
ncbi:MAG TPA: signal peptidase II [Fimbriiglobus sp.]|jgi:lipoprotein signal peptidase|nr:signal peptidase II [Fimbriiglobus sp.]